MTPAEPRRRPGPAPRFTREEIVATALELIDTGPPDSFSMRRLAQHLGINPMTLYGYVSSRDDMLEAATLLAAHRVHEEPDPEAPLRDKLHAAVRDLYNVSVQHPNLARMVLGLQTTSQPGLFRTRERVMQLLLDAGLSEERALRALGILSYYALGFGIGRANRGPLPELPADAFPSLARVADRYREHASGEAFTLGLDTLIDGLCGPPAGDHG